MSFVLDYWTLWGHTSRSFRSESVLHCTEAHCSGPVWNAPACGDPEQWWVATKLIYSYFCLCVLYASNQYTTLMWSYRIRVILQTLFLQMNPMWHLLPHYITRIRLEDKKYFLSVAFVYFCELFVPLSQMQMFQFVCCLSWLFSLSIGGVIVQIAYGLVFITVLVSWFRYGSFSMCYVQGKNDSLPAVKWK